MIHSNASIRDYLEVRAHPTVVRLQDLDSDDAHWLSESFVLTSELQDHLHVLTRLFTQRRGCGVFLIGHYGAGKSHFLAYLTQQLRAGKLVSEAPEVVPLSLVNFSAANRLEDILTRSLHIEAGVDDRRPGWDAMLANYTQGLLLVVDELSEFLRSKPDNHAFSEDVRLLQFIAEWAQEKPCWIIAAMQEGIEHTGELEYDLYRKIKDRYPLRLLLTPAHVKDLIADGILVKKPGYESAVDTLCRTLHATYPGPALDFDVLRAVYPLHPTTLDLLEEVRDRFSKARGVVDFTVTQLRGDPMRGIEPYLDRPWGSLITPDVIIDHFRDLFEVQPEFVPLAQQVFPWYQRHLDTLFERSVLRTLADRILKLLVLTYLSPARDGLSAQETATWLLFSAAQVEPDRNYKIIARVLTTLAERGRYVVARSGRYYLDLRDDAGAALDRLLARELAALKGQDALVLETLIPLLPPGGFNPFSLPRDAWQHRRLRWHFHERRYAVWLGDRDPTPMDSIGLCLRLPWGETQPAANLYTVQPARVQVHAELVELAALARLRERPVTPELRKRIQQRIQARVHFISQALRTSWQEARLTTPEGITESAPRLDPKTDLDAWLETLALWVLRRTYPGFERFAPSHGPLPKQAWLRFMRFAAEEDIGAEQADDFVKLIREAYLVPMGLLRRKGRRYVTPGNLDRHELVRLVTPLLEHNPSPKTVHRHLAEPIYGLVPDQVNLLLVVLVLQGEIDILKDRKSYRETFETLPNPIHYDRVIPAHGLSMEQINALEQLCEGFSIRTPAHWSVLTQRRCALQLAKVGRAHVERLQTSLQQLQGIEQGRQLAVRLQSHIDHWSALEKGEHVLQGLEHFLFEISSVASFLEQVKDFQELPQRLQQLLGETRRFVHLFQHPAVRHAACEEGLIDLDAVPGLDEPQRLQEWLTRAGEIYRSYKQDYRERHERWWKTVAEHPVWHWEPPPLASSQHVGLAETLGEFRAARRKAEELRCRALVNLDYQPQCACGFDGESAPIAPLLDRLAALRETIGSGLRLFFQQDAVKARLHDWQRNGVEMNAETLSYLEGTRSVPEVRDVASFDEYLRGAELAAEMDLAPVVELLCQRLWKPDELLQALQRQFATRGGQRLRFTGSPKRAVPPEVLNWCAEHCVKYGIPLPQGLNRADLTTITQALRPEWVGAEALKRLDGLDLDEAGVERILGWVIQGYIPLPEGSWSGDSLLAAVAMMVHPEPLATPWQLAQASYCLYHAHGRLHRLAGEQWLVCLKSLAATPLTDLPPLVEVLKGHKECQWLLLDCLGLPLLKPLEPMLRKAFSAWTYRAPLFARVPATTTDACYRELLNADINHAFEKTNVIDELIHQQVTPFNDLVALAVTQLEIACRRLLPRFDPGQCLLIFADHGFRIAADGHSYQHGGASTLEKVVPVWAWDAR